LPEIAGAASRAHFLISTMNMRVAEMPTQTRRSFVPNTEAPTTFDARPPSITPLATIAILAFVLHLAMGAVLDRSHAGPTIASAAVGASDDETRCAAEAKPPEPVLPHD
jgi:hypothetical protein